MKIVGRDLHTRYQQIAMLDAETGELVERRLEHENREARAFYAALSSPVRVGIEATGHTRWFERMLAELGHELWIGDAFKPSFLAASICGTLESTATTSQPRSASFFVSTPSPQPRSRILSPGLGASKSTTGDPKSDTNLAFRA